MLGCRCEVSAIDLWRSMCWPSKIDVSTFEDWCVDLRRSMCWPSKIDVSTFEDRWSMCQPSKIDVLTFEDWCVDFWWLMMDVSTFEDWWSMCRPSKIDGRCFILWRPMIDVKLCCYTCSKHWRHSCMRIALRGCISVLSFIYVRRSKSFHACEYMYVFSYACVRVCVRACVCLCVCVCMHSMYGMHQTTSRCGLMNGAERVIPFPFNNISLSVHDPFPIRLRSVRIFCPFWVRFNLFTCCAICFSTWQSYVRFCSCSFRPSRSTALQVMASTLDRTQLPECTRAGVRRYLKSTTDTCVVRGLNLIVPRA